MKTPRSLSTDKKNLFWYAEVSKRIFSHPVLTSYRLIYNTKRFISDYCLYPLGFYNYQHQIIFLAGMAMSGSTWIKNLLSRVPGVYTRFTPMPVEVSYNQNI